MNHCNLSLTAVAALLVCCGQSSQAATTTNQLTNGGGTGTWQTGTNWSLAVPASGAGNIATYATAAAAATALDVASGTTITIGQVTKTSTGAWTINTGTATGGLILNDNGATVGNPFGFTRSAIANTGASGNLTVNVPVTIGASANLEVGVTGGGGVTLGGNLTASAGSNLLLKANGAGAVNVSGSIGASGSAIAIQNTGSSTGTTTLSGNIGSSVTTVVENSTGSLLILSGTNAYTSTTTITNGTLRGLNSAATNVLQSFSTGTINLNAGTLQLRANGTGNNQTIVTGDGTTGNNVAVGGATTIDVSRATANTGGTFQFNNLSIGASTLNVTGANSYALQFAGTTTLTGNATFNPTTAGLTLSGAIGDGGSGLGFTKTGAGTLVVSGTNTYTGATIISAGKLQAGAAAGGQAFGNLSAVSLANAASTALDLNNFNQTIGSLTGGGTTGGNVTLGSATLTTGGDNTSPAAYAGVISGTGSLVKTGSGTQTLTGANTYSGGTTVANGNLSVNNTSGSATGTGAVDVQSGAILSGGNTTGVTTAPGSASLGIYAAGVKGIISGPLTIQSGAHLAPGNSVGTLTTATLTLNLGSLEDYEFNGTANDFTSVSGVLTLNGGGFNLYQEGTTTAFSTVGLYDLLSYGSLAGTGIGSLSVANMQAGFTYTFIDDNVDKVIQLQIVAVPEPGTWAMMIGGMALLVFCQRRKLS